MKSRYMVFLNIKGEQIIFYKDDIQSIVMSVFEVWFDGGFSIRVIGIILELFINLGQCFLIYLDKEIKIQKRRGNFFFLLMLVQFQFEKFYFQSD